MVSKRTRYASESTDDDMEYLPNNHQQSNKPARKPTRTPKCFTKNALMARENRLKKKMYIGSLETQVEALKNDNKKLTQIVDNQAFMIDELKKEVRYLKSVLANSESIGKLIHAINTSTGLGVTTSLGEKTPIKQELVNNNPTGERKVPEVDKSKQSAFDITRHPWEDNKFLDTYTSYPTPDSTNSYYESPSFDELSNEGLLLDMDLPIEMDNNDLLDMIDEKALETPLIPLEHNYHNPMNPQNDIRAEDDVGVCLHVSNNKVSLEFCPTCSESASQSKKAS